MVRRILVINGHPDDDPGRLCAALARSYREGASRAGHEVRSVALAGLEVPFLSGRADDETGELPPAIRSIQADILWADHLAVVFPLWLGGLPAKLKALFEQALRQSFAFGRDSGHGKPRLKGRSVRVIVTMGMPAIVYRLVFGAAGVRSFTQGVLGLAGLGPVRTTLMGSVESHDSARRARWLREVQALGGRAA